VPLACPPVLSVAHRAAPARAGSEQVRYDTRTAKDGKCVEQQTSHQFGNGHISHPNMRLEFIQACMDWPTVTNMSSRTECERRSHNYTARSSTLSRNLCAILWSHSALNVSARASERSLVALSTIAQHAFFNRPTRVRCRRLGFTCAGRDESNPITHGRAYH